MEVEPALRLDNFARTNFPGGARDHPADLGIVEVGRKIEGLGKQAIAQQHAERISPARIHRRLGPAPFRFVHGVVMHQGGDVNQLDDHRQIEMTGRDPAARAAA